MTNIQRSIFFKSRRAFQKAFSFEKETLYTVLLFNTELVPVLTFTFLTIAIKHHIPFTTLTFLSIQTKFS